ncbi:MAG: hypothetical protein ACYDD4_13835, partial [Acidimicrobiales bacterium]
LLVGISGGGAADAGAGRLLAVLHPGSISTISADATEVPAPLVDGEGPGTVTPETQAGTGTGEGELWLTMDAPGTSWASPVDTSAVVDVTVGSVTQQIVLFSGSTPFTYTGFTGLLATGQQTVTVHVDTALSHTLRPPTVDVLALTLGVVPATSPQFDALAYAPVVYGRTSAASRYTQLLMDVAQSTDNAGNVDLGYTYVISAHDQGDSIVPAYQWALWGRMTDIVSVMDETVSPGGSVLSASYASCGCESIPHFPDSVMAPVETSASLPAGDFHGTHPVIRDASATNYASDNGTTAFRFQQAPVLAPPPGQVREAVMDEHPWTYQLSNEELPREHVISTNPRDLLVGDYRQYAVIDSDVEQSRAQDVQFDVQLAGDPTWYSTDYRQMTGGVPSTFPFNDGGHNRTVIKLPLDWGGRAITAMRIRLEAPAGSSASARLVSLEVLEVTDTWQVLSRTLPAQVTIVSGTSLEPEDVPS